MQTEVILMQDVPGLGKQGDVTRVTAGYARNFLYPKRLAAPATPKHVRMLEMERKRREAEARRAVERVRQEAEKLSQVSCTIAAHAGEDGKLFGSITAQDIADQLEQAGYSVDKRLIDIPEPIKELGVYTVEVRLHADITAAVKVWVVEK